MADTFKFSTLIWLIAAAFIPLWPISAPVCLYMAYRSYKAGTPNLKNLIELQTAVDLNKTGHLSDEELAAVKTRTLGIPSPTVATETKVS